MGWLLRDGDVLASLETANGTLRRAKGLLGRDGIDGALLIRPAMSVPTHGMRFPIDVAFCDRQLRVVDIVSDMRPWRVGRPRPRARVVIEAESGSFERWALRIGDELEVT